MTNSAIYFKSLELENVRCFGQRQRLDLTAANEGPAQWILILGENNIGKTTLLQCLAWMRPVLAEGGPERENSEGESSSKGSTKIEPALNKEENEILNSLIRARNGGDVKVDLKAELVEGLSLCCKNQEEAVSITTNLALVGRKGRLEEASALESIRDSNRSLPDLAIFAYGATRRPGTVKRDGDLHIDTLASLFDNAGELYDAEDVLLKLDHRAKSGKSRDESVLKEVKEVLARVLPHVNDASDIRISAPEVLGHQSKWTALQFDTPYGTVPLSRLSDGYQTMLTWVVDLALRLYEFYPTSPKPLAEPGIVLIDELDLHLHPSWQRGIIEHLTDCFPAVQFIATAHSPLIVQAADKANLAVLHEKDGQVEISNHRESYFAWRPDQILASELFGIPARGKRIEELRSQRDDLLNKLDRSVRDEERLKSLREQLEILRTAEDPEDQAAMDLIRRVAAKLNAKGSDGS